MKILHVINSLGIGGAETLVTNLVIDHSKFTNVTVFVLGNKKTFLTEKMIENNINLIQLSESIYSIKNIIWLINNVKKFDIVHSHLSYAQYYVAFASLFNNKVQYITTEHSTLNRRRQKKIFKLIDGLMYTRYQKIVVISEGAKQTLSQWIPMIKRRIYTIYNGIDTEKYKNGKKLRELDNDFTKILMIGAFREEKNQDMLIEAINVLSDQYQLVLVGDGERKQELIDLIGKYGLEKKVKFLGVRSDVEDILKSCDIFAMSSHWEGFGLVVVEAMAAGIPVIASKVAGLEEVVGENGLFFEPNNIIELVNNITKISSNAELRKKMINDGFNRAESFTLQNCSKKYLDLYGYKN